MLAFALILSISTFGQVVQWSNPTKLKGTAIFTKVIGENENGIYVLRYRNKFFSKNIIIDKYYHHLSLDQSRNIELKKSRMVKIKMTSQGILLVKSKFERRRQSNVLSAQYYDYDLRPIGKEVELLSSPIKEFGDRGDFRVRISENMEFIGVYHSQRTEENQLIADWALFDKELKQIRRKSVVLPIKHKKFYLMNFMLSDQGNIYSLAREIIDIKDRDNRTVDRFFIQEKDSLWNLQLTDSVVYKDLKMTYDRKNQQLHVVGFYGHYEMYGSQGLSKFSYDLRRSISSQSFTPFDETLTSKLNTGKHSANIIPEGFEIIKVVARSDGGFLCVAEQKEIATENDIVMVNGIPTSTSKNIYNYNDIMVLNADSLGVIEWSHVIHKNQTTVNDGGYFSSAVVFVDEHFVQLIYNDQLRSTGEVMQVTIYTNGKQLNKKLLKTELDFVVVIPVESEQVASNKMIIPTSKNRRFALLKLVYD